MMLPAGLVVAGVALVLVAWGTYLATIPKGTVPARPIGTLTLQFAGVGCAIAGLVLSPFSLALAAPAGFAIFMGLSFPALLTLRKTPLGKLQVKVGDTLLSFETTDSDGAAFHTDSIAGQRVLLKFFRGAW